MKLSTCLQKTLRVRCRQGIALIALMASLAMLPVFAGTPYLASGHPDGIALLPPPPPPGSGEEAADLAASRQAFAARTPAETERAKKDYSIAFTLFDPSLPPLFQSGMLPKTQALLSKVRAEIGTIIDAPKNFYKRKRPYQVDEKLDLGAPEDSLSYPSGHSTRGTVYSLILAEIFPGKSEQILQVGRNIGWDRVLIGKHFLTDIQAGRILGKAIVRELLDTAAFQHDLAEAKAEAAEALKSSEALVETGK